jgi:hypothetical protein
MGMIREELEGVGKALARIDKRRQKLIDAQNDLVLLLRAATPFTRQTFSAFYSGGGITAEDWQRNRFAYTGVGVVHQLVGNGQLRVCRVRPTAAQPTYRSRRCCRLCDRHGLVISAVWSERRGCT